MRSMDLYEKLHWGGARRHRTASVSLALSTSSRKCRDQDHAQAPSSTERNFCLGSILLALFLLTAAPAASEEDLNVRIRAARLRVQALMAQEEWEAAEVQLRRLAAHRPEDIYVLGDLAVACQRQGKIDAAIAFYRRLLPLAPEKPAYRRDMAYLLYETGRYPEVVELFARAAEPPRGELRRLLADALDRVGQRQRADGLYAAALAQSPEDADLLLTVGERLLNREESQEALPYLRRAHILQPREPRLLKALALAVQEEDPEQYRQYLLPVLVLDKTDAEVPFLIGELYRPEAPVRAAKYYRAALERLEKKAALEPYEQTLKARLLGRLGEPAQAEAMLRDLLERNPESTDLRLDLAQLLIDTGRLDEGLDALPADSVEARAAWPRLDISQQRHDWPGQITELAFLTDREPGDWRLRLDLADALARNGRWPEALQLCDSLLVAPPARAAAERAFELRHALRQRRGTALALEATHTGLPDESAWGARPSLRWQFSPRTSASARWISGLYEDDALPDRPAFSERVDEFSVELAHAPHPDWEIGVQGRGYLGNLETRPGLGVRLGHILRRGGTLEFEVRANELWTEPVDAVAHEGLFHRAGLALSTPLFARLYLQSQASWRRFQVRGDQRFGHEGRMSLFLGREQLRLPYGSDFPLRSASLSLAFEEARSDQRARLAELLQLQEKYRAISLNLFTHFLFGGRAFLDLSLSAGLDPERDLGPGELYGLSAEFNAALNPRLSLYAGGAFASESGAQAAGGSYRQARVGIIYYSWFANLKVQNGN